MTFFNELPNLLLVSLGIYSSVVNFICRNMLTNNPSPFTKITSDTRVTALLRSRIGCGISTYYVTTSSDAFIVVLPFRYATSVPKNVLAMVTASGVTGKLRIRP